MIIGVIDALIYINGESFHYDNITKVTLFHFHIQNFSRKMFYIISHLLGKYLKDFLVSLIMPALCKAAATNYEQKYVSSVLVSPIRYMGSNL